MAITGKQRREKRRENTRELQRQVTCHRTYRVYVEQFIAHQMEIMHTPFLNALRSERDFMAKGSFVPYGKSVITEGIGLQRQHNELVKFTTRYIAMSSTLEDREQRLLEVSVSPIVEMLRRLESEMVRLAFGGNNPFLESK